MPVRNNGADSGRNRGGIGTYCWNYARTTGGMSFTPGTKIISGRNSTVFSGRKTNPGVFLYLEFV